MKYVIFKTEIGFFGILTQKGTIVQTSLPTKERKTAKNNLLNSQKNAKQDPSLLLKLQTQIKLYFEGKNIDFNADIDLNLEGLTQFSQDILKACQKIPYGQTVSYKKLAEMANHPKAARAVGNVMGNNPIPLIIPCHRVIKSNGSIGGFQRNTPGAQDLKKRMLELERNI
jgi:methylated-DNA-[protein]-cysteine S-methyltransferase